MTEFLIDDDLFEVFTSGFDAAEAGIDFTECPHEDGTFAAEAWKQGWLEFQVEVG